MTACGFVEFNNGNREAITLYHKYNDGSIRFNTATGRYFYQEQVENLEGILVPHHAFMKVEMVPDGMLSDGTVTFSDRYTEIDTIKMFAVYPEKDCGLRVM